MRGPKGVSVGSLKRVLISNVSSYRALPELCSIISGVPQHYVEDIKISDVYFHQLGGGTEDMAELQPPERENEYPEPTMFGTLPANGFFLRHIKDLEMSNIEVATEQPDLRPAFWLHDVNGADLFRVKTPISAPHNFFLNDVRDFRVFASHGVKDINLEHSGEQKL
jgi:hypothetical protein